MPANPVMIQFKFLYEFLYLNEFSTYNIYPMIKPEEYNQKGNELKYIGSLYSLSLALSKKWITINKKSRCIIYIDKKPYFYLLLIMKFA